MKKITTLFILLTLLCLIPSKAQKLSIQAPSQAEVGQRFRVSYSYNGAECDGFKLDGDFTGMDVLFGPSTSTSTSIRIINGHTSQSSNTTFTYLVTPRKAGTFTLPSASVSVGGNRVKSGTSRIEVLPGAGSSRNQQSQQGNQGGYYGGNQGGGNTQSQSSQSSQMHTPTSGEHIGPKDLYFSVTASKHRVFEQEAILLTYKLYSLVTVEQLAGEMPQLDGFHTQEIELPDQRSFTMERVGNKNYGTVVWRQYVVFPQRSGKLTIPAIDYEADVVTQDRSVDPFDAFFGGGSISQRVKKIVKAPAVTIQVDPLPAKPANFSGAVGHGFSINAKLIPEQVDANDATTMVVSISGTGNMKLMSAPTIQWPKDFESYDPKTTEKTHISTGGLTGSVTYECMAVPHHAGKFDIPPVEFCYFDTDSHQYKTIKTKSFTLGVAKGTGTRHVVEQEDLKELGTDIRYIKQGDAEMLKVSNDIFGSTIHWLSYVILLLLFLITMVIFHRQVKANSDIVHQRGRKAGKAAAKRLKQAGKLLKAGKEADFYDEVMRALWGYVADKLNLPVTDLNKDNVSERLQLRNVDEDTTKQFLNVLSECEFARFAPGDPATNMEHLFDNATQIINHLDEIIQKK